MIVKNLPEFHKKVCERDRYICRGCSKDFSYDHYFNEKGVNQYTTGHHYPHTQKARPDLRLDTNNGVCLCAECHTKAHKGLLEITEVEFEESIEVDRKSIESSADYILPSGQRIQLRGNEKFCKCGFIANNLSDKCMSCDRLGNKSCFKPEKKKKRKK